MPESTLSLSIDDLKGEIGHYLGYGRGTPFSEPAWTTAQTNNITALLKSCLSQVYTPPELNPGEGVHNWSFLRPFVNVTLPSDVDTVELPEDFGGFEGPIYVASPSVAIRRFAIPTVHEGTVQQAHAAQPDTVGAPRMICEKVLAGTSYSGSTRSSLYVWPTSDAEYTLVVQYKHLPGVLTGSFPYPPGGAEHAELFKASALAAAELQLDDSPGPRYAFFMQRLAASVLADRKRKGNWIGYNGDRSDARFGPRGMSDFNRCFDNPGVTYNGDSL